MRYKALLFSLIFIISACSPTNEASRPFTEIESDILNSFDTDKVYASIKELSNEPRVAGMESELKSSMFLTEQLELYGYKVEVQPFEFDTYFYPETVSLTVNDFNGSLSPAPFKFSVTGNITGELIDVKNGRQSDYNEIDAEGKIVLVAASDISFSEIVLYATEAGATAVIVYFTKDLSHEGWALDNNHKYIPALTLSNKEGTALNDFMNKNDSIKVHLTIDGAAVTKGKSQNVIVTKKPSTYSDATDDIVIIGAHYDSVNESPGASDNASGTAVLLEVARIIKDSPSQSEIRFIFFGSEEIGLKGSESYVNKMTKDEIKRTVAMFNLDMVGSADAGILTMFTVDGTLNAATQLGNKANEDLFSDTLSVKHTESSDHSSFHYAGIPSVLFSHFPLEEWYHSPNDTIDKMSNERLENITKVIALAILELTTPKMTE